MSDPIIACRNLTIRYPDSSPQIRNISFEVAAGECFALVGRSGSGKTTITKALLGLHHSETLIEGEIRFRGKDLSHLDQTGWKRIRGMEIGYVSQNPWSACDPRRPVFDHLREAWHCRGHRTSPSQIIEALERVGVIDAKERAFSYPHQWSGGMLQRASIAAATAHLPSLILADEPTSALDSDLASAVFASIKKRSSAVLLVSHDMELVMQNADRVGVLHEGQLVEIMSPKALNTAPHHSATKIFLDALDVGRSQLVKAVKAPIISLENVSVRYQDAADAILKNVHLSIAPGEIIGILGPSGSGKSSLLKLVTGLCTCVSGSVRKSPALERPGAIMPVFQDPSASLPLSWPVWRVVTEPLTASHLKRSSRKRRREIAKAALSEVGLGDLDIDAKTWELSIGQKQRVCISRLQLANPKLIVADEPTSALDTISCQKISGLLTRLAEKGTAILIVSHNETLLKRICDRRFQVDPGTKNVSPI